ncbi:MAG: hypothetical protein H6Q33_5147, partial [Deltaproteobacteria bacterium]|nr:hypothetical protein [Deltaproteobacteria bacterium]
VEVGGDPGRKWQYRRGSFREGGPFVLLRCRPDRPASALYREGGLRSDLFGLCLGEICVWLIGVNSPFAMPILPTKLRETRQPRFKHRRDVSG